jgi:hypothetical protein
MQSSAVMEKHKSQDHNRIFVSSDVRARNVDIVVVSIRRSALNRHDVGFHSIFELRINPEGDETQGMLTSG